MAWTPDRGDVVRISMNPRAGHEQAGRGPAVVLSPATYNGKVGHAILCPITSQVKGYPFEVPLPADLPVTGVVLSDQAKSLDWRARKAEFMCALPPKITQEVLLKLGTLLTPQEALVLGGAQHLRSMEPTDWNLSDNYPTLKGRAYAAPFRVR
jgi:mRNA interferase MazF